MSVFRHAVMREKFHHSPLMLDHLVLAVGAVLDANTKSTKQTFGLAMARTRRPWFERLRENSGEPGKLSLVPTHSE